MRKNISVLVSFIFIQIGFSQVGINTTTPNAQLEIKSTNQATPSNTDGIIIPKIDAFPVVNPTASQQGMMVYLTTTVGLNTPGFYYWDNSTISWISLKGVSDADWFVVGGTSSPTSTNDNMYHMGNVAIGKNTANFPLEVSSTNALTNFNLNLNASTNISERIGIANSISGSSNDDFSFIKNNIFGTGTGYKYGLNNIFNSTANGLHYGLFNDFQNPTTFNIGVANNLRGNGRGLDNDFTGADIGDRYGTYTRFSSNSSSGNGTWFGHNVTFDYVTTTSCSGDKYGYSVSIPPSVGGGTHYGIQSYVGNLTNGYAGYFSGRVSIGDTSLDTDHYILPISRGTAGQIMQTDGSGNVTWQDPNAVMGNNFWKTTGNAGTSTTTNFIGTTDNMDLVFRRNNIKSGLISGTNTGFGFNSLSSVMGVQNTGFGASTLYRVTGTGNTAVGLNALKDCQGGNYNTGLGHFALNANLTGVANIGIGNQALNLLTSGSTNIAIGFQTLYSNNGSNNVAVGSSALSNNLGSNNIAIGHNAGFSETGSHKLYIENSNSATPLIYGEFDNDIIRTNTRQLLINDPTVNGIQMVIKNSDKYRHGVDLNLDFGTAGGEFLTATAENQSETAGIRGDGDNISIWSPGDGNRLLRVLDEDNWSDNNGNPYDNNAEKAYIDANGQYFQVSDANKKENILVLSNAIDKINKLNGYTYNFKLNPEEIKKNQKNETAIGFLAQELEIVLPQAVSKNEFGEYHVNYSAVIPLTVQAIKEQQKIIESQENKINSLEERLVKLEALLNKK